MRSSVSMLLPGLSEQDLPALRCFRAVSLLPLGNHLVLAKRCDRKGCERASAHGLAMTLSTLNWIEPFTAEPVSVADSGLSLDNIPCCAVGPICTGRVAITGTQESTGNPEKRPGSSSSCAARI